MHALAVNTVLKNFRIEHVLGIGGFGVTYRAHDQNLNCTVAIKEYFPNEIAQRDVDGNGVSPKTKADQESYQTGLKRFLEEAQLLAQFKVPTIARVNSFISTNGTAYIIMDYEEGMSLSHYLRTCSILLQEEILKIVVPILEGLREVHSRDFLHRDIKPANIYLRSSGLPVLLDFGSARHATSGSALTSLISPGYAPFEQYNTREVQGPWTDLYAVGATMYRCITGKTPLSSIDRFTGLQKDGKDPLKSAVDSGAGRYEQFLLSAIDWLLQVNIKDRPASIDEILPRLKRSSSSSEETQLATTVVVTKPYIWDPDAMEKIEAELIKYLGPIAGAMVEQHKRTSGDLRQLRQALAGELDRIEERDLFLQNTYSILQTEVNTGPTTSPSRQNTGGTTGSRTLDPNTIRQAEQELVKYMGPVASALVQEAADKCQTVEELIEYLSEDIPTANERFEFRNRVIRRNIAGQ